MNNGQLIINSLWSNSIHEQLFIKLLWTTDHAWTIGLSIWTIDHMANCSCMNKLFIIYEQLFIISKIVHKLFIAWTIGHSMDNPSDIHKILNGCFLLFRLITKFFLAPHHLTKWACFSFTHRLSLSCGAHQHHWCWQAGRLIGIKSCAVLSSPLCCEHHSCETPVTQAFLYCLL